jgi:hypothetical protein
MPTRLENRYGVIDDRNVPAKIGSDPAKRPKIQTITARRVSFSISGPPGNTGGKDLL